MRYLAEHCKVVRATEIGRLKNCSDKAVAAITFDDAFESVAEYALPILDKYKLPASIFVPTGSLGLKPQWLINGSRDPDENETVMDRSRIAELSGDSFEFLSHSVSHRPLTELGNDQLENELVESRNVLEEITGQKVSAISYPLGEYNDKVCEAARQAGYEIGFTIEPRTAGFSDGMLRMGRFNVRPDDGLIKFKLKVSGAYEVSRYLRKAKSLLKGRVLRGGKSVEAVQSYC